MNTDDKLVADYLTWTGTSLSELTTFLDKIKEGSEPDGMLSKDMYGIAHNFKGMGTSFGFPLMTDLGTTLCVYLHDEPFNKDVSVPIIDAHLKAMSVIIDKKIMGDGGEMGETLKNRILEIISDNRD